MSAIGMREDTPPMIDVQDLSFSFPDQPLLFDGFDWHVAAQQSWAVVGPSGCGKSTLLYLLAGLRKPTTGKVLVGGQMMSRPRPRTGLVLQDYGLLPWATVAENAVLGLRVRRFYGPDGRHAPSGPQLDAREIEERIDLWLSRLGISELRHQYPAQLSGGQRQRAAIARTLAMNPDTLLMDEPFSSLDTLTRENLELLTLELCRETGVTAVVVTHNIEEAVYLGRRLLLLRRPPHCEPLIIDNPGAGQPDYRQAPAFQDRCNEVRFKLRQDPNETA
jgi:NitT/TauT family transport system ATP-binding protein